MKTLDSILNTAHIHLDNATFRVHVNDTDAFDIITMNVDKPNYVLWISRSSDSTERKTSLIVSVTDGYNLEEIAEWINKNKKQKT